MEGISVGAGLGALGFWSFVAVAVVAGVWAAIRKREAQHETLRRMVESGQPIDQALVDRLMPQRGDGSDHLDRDLKVSGLITLFIAPGIALLGWLISLQAAKALFPLLGVAALVGCVSIGLLVAARVIEHRHPKDDASAIDQTKA